MYYCSRFLVIISTYSIFRCYSSLILQLLRKFAPELPGGFVSLQYFPVYFLIHYSVECYLFLRQLINSLWDSKALSSWSSLPNPSWSFWVNRVEWVSFLFLVFHKDILLKCGHLIWVYLKVYPPIALYSSCFNNSCCVTLWFLSTDRALSSPRHFFLDLYLQSRAKGPGHSNHSASNVLNKCAFTWPKSPHGFYILEQ